MRRATCRTTVARLQRHPKLFPLSSPNSGPPARRSSPHLVSSFGFAVSPEDVLAYIAADLVRPGLRVPITAEGALFAEAVKLGREVVWLHCYGERFADPKEGRPPGPPRSTKGEGPVISKGGGMPGAHEPLPDTMDYDPATRRLGIGKGVIDNVPQAVWNYEVSGKNVLRQWFSYRKLDRSRPIIGDRRPPSPLDKIQPDHWLDDYTTDLMNLLHVLGRLVKLRRKLLKMARRGARDAGGIALAL